MNTLDVLLLVPQLPYPPHQGTSLRNFNIIRGIAGRHRVHLLAVVEAQPAGVTVLPDVPEPLAELVARVELAVVPPRTRVERVRRLLTDRRPDMAHRIYGPAYEQALERLLRAQPFNIIQVEGIELAPALDVIQRLQPQAGVVFDDHNAEAALQARAFQTDLRQPRRWPAAAYSWGQTARLERFERWACHTADWITAVSDADRESLLGLLGPSAPPITVVPNAIDVTRYQLPVSGEVPRYDVVFSGKMDYRPNVDAMLWFGREIWPLIRQNRPETTFAIIGQKPHPRLDALRELPGVTITGMVPAVEPYLAGATVYVMPLRMGSGTRLKLIEAMAAGVPIVSTSLGAEGYPVRHSHELLLADEPAAFARAVLRLLENRDMRARLIAAGRHMAWQFDWRRVMPAFLEIYERIGLEVGS